MAQKVKVRDLKPKKDAKGGGKSPTGGGKSPLAMPDFGLMSASPLIDLQRPHRWFHPTVRLWLEAAVPPRTIFRMAQLTP